MCSRYASGAVHCIGGGASGQSVLPAIFAVLLILAPIATAVYLGWRATRNTARLKRSAHAW